MKRLPIRVISVVLSVIIMVSPSLTVYGEKMREYRSVQTDDMRIALTFDDGPHPTLTPRILAILEKYGIPATFLWLV